MNRDFTLAVDGSTYAGSVALIAGRAVIAERQLAPVAHPGKSGKAESFMPMVAECLRDGQVRPSDLSRIVCGEGPGSFTSLRVAASIAKGIAVGANISLFPVSSLLLIVARESRADGSWLATLPAMRGEFFAEPFAVEGGLIRSVAPVQIVAESSIVEHAAGIDAKIVGAAGKPEQTPHARGVALLLDTILASPPADIDSWEPVYGRLAEAQVKWEAAHGRPLTASG